MIEILGSHPHGRWHVWAVSVIRATILLCMPAVAGTAYAQPAPTIPRAVGGVTVVLTGSNAGAYTLTTVGSNILLGNSGTGSASPFPIGIGSGLSFSGSNLTSSGGGGGTSYSFTNGLTLSGTIASALLGPTLALSGGSAIIVSTTASQTFGNAQVNGSFSTLGSATMASLSVGSISSTSVETFGPTTLSTVGPNVLIYANSAGVLSAAATGANISFSSGTISASGFGSAAFVSTTQFAPSSGIALSALATIGSNMLLGNNGTTSVSPSALTTAAVQTMLGIVPNAGYVTYTATAALAMGTNALSGSAANFTGAISGSGGLTLAGTNGYFTFTQTSGTSAALEKLTISPSSGIGSLTLDNSMNMSLSGSASFGSSSGGVTVDGNGLITMSRAGNGGVTIICSAGNNELSFGTYNATTSPKIYFGNNLYQGSTGYAAFRSQASNPITVSAQQFGLAPTDSVNFDVGLSRLSAGVMALGGTGLNSTSGTLWCSQVSAQQSSTASTANLYQAAGVTGSGATTSTVWAIGAGTATGVTGAMNSSVLQLTTSATGTLSAGTIVSSMPFQGPSYKKVVIYLNGLTVVNNVVYTFPVAFTQTPAVFNMTGLSITASASTTAYTITAATSQSGFVFIEGY